MRRSRQHHESEKYEGHLSPDVPHDVLTVLLPPGNETMTTRNNAAQHNTLKLHATSAESCTNAESDARRPFQSECRGSQQLRPLEVRCF